MAINTKDVSGYMRFVYNMIRKSEHNFYDRYPDEYERLIKSIEQRHNFAKVIRSIVEDNFSQRRPGLVRDLAAGTGLIANELVHVGDRVVASDVSSAMMDYGRRTKDPRIEWEKGDINDLSGEKKNSVDVVTLIGASRFIKDIDVFHRQLARILTQKDGMAVMLYSDRFWNKGQQTIQQNGLYIAEQHPFPIPTWMEKWLPAFVVRRMQQEMSETIKVLRRAD